MANVSMHGFSAADIDRLRLEASSPVTGNLLASSATPVSLEPITTAQTVSNLDSLWDQAFNILKDNRIIDCNGELFESLQLRHLPKLTFGQLIRLNRILDDPCVCKFKLDEQGESFEFPFIIRNYLLQLLGWCGQQDERFLIEDFEIVGGSVAYILGWEYFEFVLNLISTNYRVATGNSIQILKLLPNELIEAIKPELSQYPKDIDIRVWMRNADAHTREEIKKAQIALLLQIASLQKKSVPKFAEAYSNMLVNAKNVNGQEQFFVMSISNRSKDSELKVDINFVQAGRTHLFDRDALSISLGPMVYSSLKYVPKSTVLDGCQFVLDRFTRRVGIREIETINERGWGVLQSLCTKGYRCFDKSQETALLNRTLKLIERDKGKFFADNLKANLVNHHQSRAIDAALLYIRYYNALEKVLKPDELKYFVDEATKYMKTLEIPTAADHPILKEIARGIIKEGMSPKDAMASLTILAYLHLESPSESTAINLKTRIINDEIEIISSINKSTYTLRAPYSLAEAIKHLSQQNSKITPTVYSTARAFTAFNPKKVFQHSTDNFDSIESMLKGDEAKRQLGYELLLLAAESTSKPRKQLLLLRYSGELLFTFKPSQRAILLEQLERVFVSGQGVMFPELFNHKVKSALVCAKSASEYKEIWFAALAKTTLFYSSSKSSEGLHFTKEIVAEISTEMVQNERSPDWDCSDSGLFALELVFRNCTKLPKEDLKKIGIRLVDALIKTNKWNRAVEILNLLKQYSPEKTDIQERLRTLPLSIIEDEGCQAGLLSLFEQCSYTDGKAWYILFKAIAKSRKMENVQEALKCFKNAIVPQDLLKGSALAYSRILKCILDVLIEQNADSLLDFCGDLNFFKPYFKTQTGNYYAEYLRKILEVLRNKNDEKFDDTQKDNFIALLDTLIPLSTDTENRDLKLFRIKRLVSDTRQSKLWRALSLVLEFYQENRPQDIPKGESFEHIRILLKKLEQFKEDNDINDSLTCLLKVLHKHVAYEALIKFAVEGSLEFSEQVNCEAILLLNTFIVEHANNETNKVNLPSKEIYVKVYLKGLPVANKEQLKEFKNFLIDTFWKNFLDHKAITTLRSRFGEKILAVYSRSPSIESCQWYLNYLIRWAEVESHTETLRVIALTAFEPLVQLVSKFNNTKLFGGYLRKLAEAVLYNPKDSKDKMNYYVDETPFLRDLSYQITFNKNTSIEVDTTMPVVSVYEKSGSRIRDAQESGYILFLKRLLKLVLKNKSDTKTTAYFRDFALYNLLTFIEIFKDKKKDIVEMMYDFVQSLHPSSSLYEKHIANCKNLIFTAHTNNIFEGHCREASELAFFVGCKKAGVKIAITEQAEILYRVVEKVLSWSPTNPYKCLVHAIQIIKNVQYLILISEGEIRFKCYQRILEAFVKIPFETIVDNNLVQILYSMIFPENHKFLSNEKKFSETNAKTACAFFTSTLSSFNSNSAKCTFDVRKTFVNNLLKIIDNCDNLEISKLFLKTYWDSFDRLMDICCSFIKDFPDKSADVTSCFSIVLKGLIVNQCSQAQAAEKIKCMSKWLNALIVLSNPLHVKIAYNVATVRDGYNMYANHSQLFLDYEARIKLLK